MSVLFGANLANEFAETVRKHKEEFDSIDIESHFRKNQWKNRSAEIMVQQKPKQTKMEHKSSLSKSFENTESADVNAFIEMDDSDEDINNTDYDSDISLNLLNTRPKDTTNDVEYLDVREQTMFRYSNKARISKHDKNKNAKTSSLSYIQNNNVRTLYKNTSNDTRKVTDDTFFKGDPFMDQKLLRQNFVIDRRRRDHSMIKDKSRICKLARNNMQFMKELLTSNEVEMKKNLVFDKRKFNRKLRFALGAPNKRRQRNYREFQHVMRKRQTHFEAKKDLYLERGLRVQSKLNEKVLFSKHGRKKIWNAGRTKSNKGKRKSGNVGGYEFAKNINEW